MSKLFISAAAATFASHLFVASSLPIQAQGIERPYGFSVNKPIQNNLQHKKKSKKKTL